MPLEIERKFLVPGDGWKALQQHDALRGTSYRQGYIHTQAGITVRVRTAGDQGYITLKGKRSGISRSEFEYPIPYDEAVEMLQTFCRQPIIDKTRHFIEYAGAVWEVDEFHGANQGLVVAEIELLDEQQEIELPDWVGEEVSDDPQYTNLQLSLCPFNTWKPST